MKPRLPIALVAVSLLAAVGCDETPLGPPDADKVDALPAVLEAKPEDGHFVLVGGYTNLTLELVDGDYRYWHSSEAKNFDDPDYPLSGEYRIEGSQIHLDHPEIHPRYRTWRFRKMNGVVTLWSEEAVISGFKPVRHELLDDGRPQYFLHSFEEFLERGVGAHVNGTILVPNQTE